MPEPVGRVLGIETATGTASVALLEPDGELRAELTFAARRSMAERLMPAIGWLLRSVDLGPDGYDAIAVGLGPGSFTSLRVGLSTVKGLLLAREVPLVGVGSLETLAAGAPQIERRPVCAVIPAPKRSVYAALHARLSDDLTNRLFGPELLTVVELAERLAGIGTEVDVAGVLAEPERQVLAAAGARLLPPSCGTPRAAVTAQLGRRLLAAGALTSVAALVPLYVHPSEPEVRLGMSFARVGGEGDDRAD